MTYTPELGQMAFGNKYESIGTPDYVTAGIQSIDLLYRTHVEGAVPDPKYPDYVDDMRTSNSGAEEVVNGVFALRSYYWGDCDCGYEQVDHNADRAIWAELGIDPKNLKWDTPTPEPYHARHAELTAESGYPNGHLATCSSTLPNFEHFASGFKAYWYKHARRGQTCNRKITQARWLAIQRECEDWVLGR